MKFLAILLIVSFPHQSWAVVCNYTLDPQSVQVNWTAFKTTQKLPVGGTFKTVSLKNESLKKNKGKRSLHDLLSGIDAQIPVKEVSAISTGNPARDQTLFDHFFNRFKNPTEIHGKIIEIMGSDSEGSLNLEVRLNDKSVKVPLKYTRTTDGHFEAKGELDILGFGLKSAFEELHHNCETLHKGPDGVSKTWSSVDLKLNANVLKKCDS